MRMFDTLVQASGTNFSIFRNSNKIATVKGLYYDELSVDLPKGKFNELIEALEKCSQKGSYDQSSLGKFSSLLQKNSWLTEPVANFILSKLFG